MSQIYTDLPNEDLTTLPKIDLLFVTATSVELSTTLSLLVPLDEDVGIYRVHLHTTTCYIGMFAKYISVIVKTNVMGTIQRGGSFQTTSEAIKEFKPKAVMMLGIGFGKDAERQSIGDILVARSLYVYDPSRVNQDGSIDYRGPNPESNITLYNRFSQQTTHEYSFDQKKLSAKIFQGPVLTGERLIDNKELKRQLFEQYPAAIGGEMEGAGIYAACDAENTPWILMKAICDWADGGKGDKYQSQAAYVVNSFAHQVLQSGTVLNALSIKPYSPIRTNEPEINLDAADLLKVLVSRKYWPEVESNLAEVRDNSNRIYYQYFCYSNHGRIEGFLFLGRHITLTKTFSDFADRFSAPDTLSVYLTKVMRNGILVDRIKGIKENAKEYKLTRSPRWEVNYIDEIIWEYTLSSTSRDIHSRRNDYIDQEIYEAASNNEHGNSLGKSTEYFIGQLTNNHESSISVILGSGGVGKTTFADALRNIFDVNLEKFRKKLVIIKGERISHISGNQDANIESLLDLYRLYETEQKYGVEYDDFKLNYICGNVVVIIDGVDEIDSSLGERFHLQNFFGSLEELSAVFDNTKIIITTRNYFEQILLDTKFSFQRFRLNGFTESDLDNYLKVRLTNPELVSQAKKFLINKELSADNYFSPMLADWACEIIIRKSRGSSSKLIGKKCTYLMAGVIIDEILLELIAREIEKQSIGCSIDGMFELLSEVVLDHNGVITKDELEEYVNIGFDEGIEKFLKNPLFLISPNNKEIRIKYDALSFLIRSRYLRHHMLTRRDYTDKTIAITKEIFDGKSHLLNDLVETIGLNQSETVELCTHYIHHLSKKLDEANSDQRVRNLEKCISGFAYLAFLKSNSMTKIERSELIENMFSIGGMVRHFFIFGDFFPLDFSDIKFMDSGFYGYSKLDECIFPGEDRAVFTYSTFDSTNITKKCGAKSTHFESTCTYRNSNILKSIESLEDSHNSHIDQAAANIISITRYIDRSGMSINMIKRHSTINWTTGHKGFIQDLEKLGYLNKDSKGHYSIDRKYSDSIADVKNGSIPLVVEELIKSLIGAH